MKPAIALLALMMVSATSASPGSAGELLLNTAERAFAAGIAHRHDSEKARTAFATAAAAYDELWHSGFHSPELAQNRANAHRLAGHLPQAIVALNEGIAVAPWSRPLQVALEEARAAVAYPNAGDLATQCRPRPHASIGNRMSAAEAWLIVALLWLIVCLAIARYAMTRQPRWLGFAGLGGIGLLTMGVLWWHDHQLRAHANRYPLVVLARDSMLRRGNAASFPARFEAPLPAGVEVRERAMRSGWIQVELAGGAIGWLPESRVFRTQPIGPGVASAE